MPAVLRRLNLSVIVRVIADASLVSFGLFAGLIVLVARNIGLIPFATSWGVRLDGGRTDQPGKHPRIDAPGARLLERRPPPDLAGQKPKLELQGALEFVGLPYTRAALETAGADFRLATAWQEIAPGLCLSGEVPRQTTYEFGDQKLKHRDATGALATDPVRDDQTVVIDTPGGLFVVLGCSHAGRAGWFSVLDAGLIATGLVAAAVLIAALTLVCGVVPSRLATAVRPAEALHYE